MSFVSYAQNLEDVLLHRVFGGQETGFYIDIGAYHPVIGSTTKCFYDRGWSGINIEPGSVFTELAEARPRDVNLQMAVLDRAGEVAFLEDKADRGMSRVVHDRDQNGAYRMVACDTLESIVRLHSNNRPIDFIKVDAEGSEGAIVGSTDWRRLRPRVLLLEATLPWSSTLANQDWEPILLSHGYVRTYFDGINCFYVPEEEVAALLHHFEVPINVLDRVETHDCEKQRWRVNELQNEVSSIKAAHDALHGIAHDRHREIADLTAERDSLRAALHDKENDFAHVASDRDMLRSTLDRLQIDMTRLTSERDVARSAHEAQQIEAARAMAEIAAIRAEASSRERETARIAEERDNALRALADQQNAQSAPTAAHEVVRDVAARDSDRSRPLFRHPVLRTTALSAYKVARPVVRPIMWRLRGFMTGSMADEMRELRREVTSLRQGSHAGEAIVVADRLRQLSEQVDALSRGANPAAGDSAVNEMRRLATEIEHAILTLALERPSDSSTAGVPCPAEATPAS